MMCRVAAVAALAVLGEVRAGEEADLPLCSFTDLMEKVEAAITSGDASLLHSSVEWQACERLRDAIGDVEIAASCPSGGGDPQPADPDVDCVGSWSACDASCESTYTVTTAQEGSGTHCETADGTIATCAAGTDACPDDSVLVPDVDCVGSWSACDASCVSTYTVTTGQEGSGGECEAADGTIVTCAAGTDACPADPDVDCDGSWSPCTSTCDRLDRTWTTSQEPSGNGAPCPSDVSATATCVGQPYDHDDNDQTSDNTCDTDHGGPVFDGRSESSCVTQYTQSFFEEGSGCSGQNEICYEGASPCDGATSQEDCERLCLDDDTCTSYEWRVGGQSSGSGCQLSTSCRETLTPVDDEWILVVRNYADCEYAPAMESEAPECLDGDGDCDLLANCEAATSYFPHTIVWEETPSSRTFPEGELEDGASNGDTCIFPFTYDGTEYNECAPYDDYTWCPTGDADYETGDPYGACLGPERCFYWGEDCCEGHYETVDGVEKACGYESQYGCAPSP